MPKNRVRDALRPFGYYHPDVGIELKPSDTGEWTIVLDIDKGPPILVSEVSVDVLGEGAKFPATTCMESGLAFAEGIGAGSDQMESA